MAYIMSFLKQSSLCILFKVGMFLSIHNSTERDRYDFHDGKMKIIIYLY